MQLSPARRERQCGYTTDECFAAGCNHLDPVAEACTGIYTPNVNEGAFGSVGRERCPLNRSDESIPRSRHLIRERAG